MCLPWFSVPVKLHAMEIAYCSRCGEMIPPGSESKKGQLRIEDQPICHKCHLSLQTAERSAVVVKNSSSPASRKTTSFHPGRDRGSGSSSKISGRKVSTPKRSVLPAIAGSILLLSVGAALAFWLLKKPEKQLQRKDAAGVAQKPSHVVKTENPTAVTKELVVILSSTAEKPCAFAPAGSPNCMRTGALVQADKKNTFAGMPANLEGQGRIYGSWFGRGPFADLFKVKLRQACTIYWISGNGPKKPSWMSDNWKYMERVVKVKTVKYNRTEHRFVWSLEAPAGPITLGRGLNNFMVNYVFVPR
jgi:hypothetical protein